MKKKTIGALLITSSMALGFTFLPTGNQASAATEEIKTPIKQEIGTNNITVNNQVDVQETGYQTNEGITINVEWYKRVLNGWQVKGKGSSTNYWFLSDNTKIGWANPDINKPISIWWDYNGNMTGWQAFWF